MSRQHLAQDATRADTCAIKFHLLAAGESQINEQLEAFAVARIANRFVVEFTDAPRETFGQGGSPAGSLKRLHLAKRLWEFQALKLRHRINFGDPTSAYDARTLDILVNQTFDGKDYLIIERRTRILRQATDADVNFIKTLEAFRTVRDENGDHA